VVIPARAPRVVAIAGPVAALAVGCNAILGITGVPVPADAGSSEDAPSTLADAGEAAVADTSVASTLDAPQDAGADSTTPSGGCGPTTDTRIDPHSCGQCGHDCLGGPCLDSVCQAFALVPVEAGVTPRNLAQDDTYLYWSDLAGTIDRTNKTTGVTNVLTRQTSGPLPVAVDDAGIWWGDDDGVWRCAKSGCTSNPTPVASTGTARAYSLAIDDQNVYWSEGTNELLLADKYAGAGGAGSILWEGDASPSELAADGQRVYFTAADGQLHAVGIDGGGALGIGASSVPGGGVALYGPAVYWTLVDPMSGIVASASTVSLDMNVIAASQSNPEAVASDGANVYWTDVPNLGVAQVKECALGSCTPVVIADNLSSPFAIVVDDVAVYWTDIGSASGSHGSLWKIAK
jgi:hypothetical protein